MISGIKKLNIYSVQRERKKSRIYLIVNKLKWLTQSTPNPHQYNIPRSTLWDVQCSRDTHSYSQISMTTSSNKTCKCLLSTAISSITRISGHTPCKQHHGSSNIISFLKPSHRHSSSTTFIKLKLPRTPPPKSALPFGSASHQRCVLFTSIYAV